MDTNVVTHSLMNLAVKCSVYRAIRKPSNVIDKFDNLGLGLKLVREGTAFQHTASRRKQ